MRSCTVLRVPPGGLMPWISNGAAMIEPMVCLGFSDP